MALSDEPDRSLDQRIADLLGPGGRMVLSTSSDGNSSGASVFYARDGDDLVFFTFNPTRKAEQIRANPRVQAVVWPADHNGIKGLQIDGRCGQIKDADELVRAREAVLAVTTAFSDYMDDPFLIENKVTGYYRLRPTSIKLVDFHATPQFEWKSFPQNQPGAMEEAMADIGRRILLWIRALRAPFFTASLVPVLLGAVIAANDVEESGGIEWSLFRLVLLGVLAAHAGTNLINDYGDHVTGNDLVNQTPSPFNGGSRVIQAGLLAPWKILFASGLSFVLCILCGLSINLKIGGAWFAPTPLLWIGIIGLILGVAYSLAPLRLSYKGFGEVAIALGFGPVIVLGTHYVLSAGHGAPWHWIEPFVASLPVSLLVMLIVWINQFQDAPADYKTGKHNWVVRLAKTPGGFDYRRPFRYYTGFVSIAFFLIVLIAALPLVSSVGTHWVLIALAPAFLLPSTIKKARNWLDRIDHEKVDWRRHPYALLPVNVATIGIHLGTGLLLTIAWWLHRVTT